MLARLALVAFSLAVAAAASADPLIGAWGSDRALTPVETGKLATLTLGQREVLSAPDLSGRLLAISGDREIELSPAERRARFLHRVVATGSDFVELGEGDEGAAEPVRVRLLLYEGLLYVSVDDLGLHEVFRRADLPTALAP